MKKAHLLLLFLCLAACASKKAVGLYPLPHPSQPLDRYAIILLVDGLPAATLDQALARARLPNIQHYFVAAGTSFTQATTVFPTVSPTGHGAILTGLYPGHSGISAISWFDRPNRKIVDYLTLWGLNRLGDDMQSWYAYREDPFTDQPPTLFHDLGKNPSLSLYTPIHWGARQAGPKNMVGSAFHYSVTRRYEELDLDACDQALRAMRLASPKKFPRLSMIALETYDAVEHHEGLDSERGFAALELIDRFVGELFELLEKKGIKDQTLVVLTADHGQHATGGPVYELESVFATHGLTTSHGFVVRDAQFVIKPRGITQGQIYVTANNREGRILFERDLQQITVGKGGDGPRFLDFLAGEKAIELLLWRLDRDHIRLRQGANHATIFRTDIGNQFFYGYNIDPGHEDPLQLGLTPAVRQHLQGGGLYSEAAWQHLTAAAIHPDAVVQIAQLFNDGRAGDIVFTVRPPFNLFNNKKAGHGGLSRQDMHVPLFFAGGDIKGGRELTTARTVDIAATLSHFLGLPRGRTMDGRVLLALWDDEDRAQNAVQPAVRALAEMESILARVGQVSRQQLLAKIQGVPLADLKSALHAEARLRAQRLARLAEHRTRVQVKKAGLKDGQKRERDKLKRLLWSLREMAAVAAMREKRWHELKLTLGW